MQEKEAAGRRGRYRVKDGGKEGREEEEGDEEEKKDEERSGRRW